MSTAKLTNHSFLSKYCHTLSWILRKTVTTVGTALAQDGGKDLVVVLEFHSNHLYLQQRYLHHPNPSQLLLVH